MGMDAVTCMPRRRYALKPPDKTFHPTHEDFRLAPAGPKHGPVLPVLLLHCHPLRSAKASAPPCQRRGRGISTSACRHLNLRRARHGLRLLPPRTVTAREVTDLLWTIVILACARTAAWQRREARRPCTSPLAVVKLSPRFTIINAWIGYVTNSEGHMDSEGNTGLYNRVIGLRDHSLVCTVARLRNYVDRVRSSSMAARAVY
jgi:hypothetical protein